MAFNARYHGLIWALSIVITLLLLVGCSDIDKSKEQSVSEMIVFPFNVTKPIEAETVQFLARLVYFDSSFEDITTKATWSSSDITVATVEQNGTVTIKNSGYSVITANYMLEDSLYIQTSTLTVRDDLLVSIDIGDENVSVPRGDSYDFRAIGTFKDGSSFTITKFLTWKSSLTDVATITKGTLFAKAETNASASIDAETIITASYKSKVAASTLTVSLPILKSIEVTYSPKPLHVGDKKVIFNAKGIFTDGTDINMTESNVTWESKDEKILKFETRSKPYEATAYSEGNVTVVAKEKGVLIGGVKGVVDVEVLP